MCLLPFVGYNSSGDKSSNVSYGHTGLFIVVSGRSIRTSRGFIRFSALFSLFKETKTSNTSTKTLDMIIYVRRLPFRRLSRCIATIVIRQNKRVSFVGRCMSLTIESRIIVFEVKVQASFCLVHMFVIFAKQ